MTLPDIIAIVAIALIVGAATLYIVISKKKGKKCIGCPDSPNCSSCSGSCSIYRTCSSMKGADNDKSEG